MLGTGVMGTGMARSLLRAGHEVTVWNRTRSKAEPLASDGAQIADDPTTAVATAEVAVVMLYDVDSVLAVMTEVGDALPADAIWVQSSTVGVEGAHRAAAQAQADNAALVDAPVLGTRKPADNGQLVVLAAAEPHLRERVAPVFDATGSRTMWVSETPGAASALKLAINAWIGAITAATGQSVTLAAHLGLDPRLFLEAIGVGATDSPYAQLKGAAMIEESFAPQFAVDGVRKDLGLTPRPPPSRTSPRLWSMRSASVSTWRRSVGTARTTWPPSSAPFPRPEVRGRSAPRRSACRH